ncbi:MAG: beta-lactamase family protein [Acidobacteriota bacterium]|nr:beta-lactamase family protein [Acidobacteriota bacterium]MDH3530499.1 beta-lactamase family protein [Acidobacteriota bacterium]
MKHSRIPKTALLALILILLFVPANASTPVEIAERRVRRMIETLSIPGLSVTVMKEGKVVWSKGFGKADLELEVPVSDKTRFRLASVSKVVTAAALARLVDSGKIDLDTPVSKYVDGLPEALGAVTSRQLAGHLAGVRHYQRKDFVPVSIDNNDYPTVLSSLSIFKDDPLLSEPGTSYQYTTFGFTLLAAVIQGASGKPFLECLSDEVFNPLGLESAGPDSPFPVTPNRTSFYMPGPNGSILNAAYVNPSYKWAGGGLLMTSADLAKFGSAHLKNGFIKPETLRMMFTTQKTSDGSETGVGITWRIAKGYFDNTIYHHEGSMHGSRSALLIYPEQGFSVAVMTNLTGTPRFAFETAQMIVQPFVDGGRNDSSIDPAGSFDVAGTIFGKAVTGTLEVRRSKEGYAGAFEFEGERMEVIGVIAHKRGYYLIVIHKTGGLDAVPVFRDGNNGPRYELKYEKKPNGE